MILLELAAQGVRGVAPAAGRLNLHPGYNVVPAAEGAALARLVAALLSPLPEDAQAIPRAAAGAAAGGPRVGATLVGKDRLTLRLIRQLGGAAELQRYDPDRRAFAHEAGELGEIARRLAAAGAPARERFELLHALEPDELPSRAAAAALPLPAAVARPLAPAEAEARRAALAEELERARAVERLQARLDALQNGLFEQERLLGEGVRLRADLEGARQARAELDAAAGVLRGLGDLEARLAARDRAAERRDEALARVAGERAALEGEAARAGGPLWRAPAFLGGLGAGAVALAAGVAGALQGSPWRYAALLDVPAFGVAALAALRAIGDLEARERAGRKRGLVEDYERKALEAYAREAEQVDGAVAALGLKAPAALREAAQRIEEAEAAVEAARAALETWEASPQTRAAVEEKARATAELSSVEEALAARAGGYLREPRAVEAELAALQAELARAAGAGGRAPRASDPLAALLAGADGSPDQLLARIGRRAAQLAGALSGGRLGAAALDAGGALAVQVGGRAVPAAGLALADRDLLYLALKLAAAEGALAGQVLVVGDVFRPLPLPARRAAAAALKQLARAGQVLHATSDPVFLEAADHAA